MTRKKSEKTRVVDPAPSVRPTWKEKPAMLDYFKPGNHLWWAQLHGKLTAVTLGARGELVEVDVTENALEDLRETLNREALVALIRSPTKRNVQSPTQERS